MVTVLITADNSTVNFGASLGPFTLATTQNNYSPAGIYAGINCLLLTPASGGSTLTGLVGGIFPSGWVMLIENLSTTDYIYFSHLSGSSSVGNQFSCTLGTTGALAPLGNSIVTYNGTVWKFA